MRLELHRRMSERSDQRCGSGSLHARRERRPSLGRLPLRCDSRSRRNVHARALRIPSELPLPRAAALCDGAAVAWRAVRKRGIGIVRPGAVSGLAVQRFTWLRCDTGRRVRWIESRAASDDCAPLEHAAAKTALRKRSRRFACTSVRSTRRRVAGRGYSHFVDAVSRSASTSRASGGTTSKRRAGVASYAEEPSHMFRTRAVPATPRTTAIAIGRGLEGVRASRVPVKYVRAFAAQPRHRRRVVEERAPALVARRLIAHVSIVPPHAGEVDARSASRQPGPSLNPSAIARPDRSGASEVRETSAPPNNDNARPRRKRNARLAGGILVSGD